MTRRTPLVCAALAAAWMLILGWQVIEHRRVRASARQTLIHRAKDISTTLGLVLRAQRRFGGVISKERIESALRDLIKAGELEAIALLSADGTVVAAAGGAIDFETHMVGTGEHWTDRTVTLANLVDLGTNVTAEAEGRRPPIVVSRDAYFGPFGTNRPAGSPPPRPPPLAGTDGDAERGARAPGRPPPNAGEGADPERPGPPGWPRSRFGRPPWMSETEFSEVSRRQGVHGFVLVLSTDLMQATTRQDFWLRAIITLLASVSVVGVGLAWQNVHRSSELEVRLARAAELNAGLKQMSLAAAGLAHETRNPLNLIRGFAQMASRADDAPPRVRQQAREIVGEADRVAAQLNEFINFTRPREPRPGPVAVETTVREVVRALSSDLDEKGITPQLQLEPVTILADEPMLRQALFNLLLNAVQAVASGGALEIVVQRTGPNVAALEVRDDGPGVPPERRAEIFQPYFTMHANGTGLGLAVVQQIVLAHGWDVACLAHEPRGAVFRIGGLRLAAR